jgi:DNA-binding NarL/FixJ family response regulator
MIKILIVDDHAIVREGLKQILSEISDMVVAGEASDGCEAMEQVSKKKYDVVILDIALPDRNGLDVLKDIKNQTPDLSVLILSMHPEERLAVRVLKAGASGYLTKTSAPDELIAAIRKVSTGGEYVTSTLAEKLAFQLRTGSEESLHETLSDREYDVMLKLASGKTVKEIAKEMHLSPKTISTHRTHILEKMGMKNNADLTEYAVSNNLIG